MFFVLVIPFALALVVISVLGFAGSGPLTDERRSDRGGLPGAVGPAVGVLLGGGLLLSAAGALLLLGLGGEERTDDDRRDVASSSTSPPPGHQNSSTDATSLATRVPTRGAVGRVVLGSVVNIEAADGQTFPESYDVADGLRPATVLQMRVTGFEPFARAAARQCAPSLARRCGNSMPVQFDADGAARFQYLVTDDFASRPIPGRCRADAAPCTVVVRAFAGGRRGEVQTVFRDRVPGAGRIEVSRRAGLSLEGEKVAVVVHDYPPGAEVIAMLCAAPSATGRRCGAPGPTAPLVVGRSGTGRVELTIEPGRVGADRVRCGRGDDCGVSVASKDVFARAPVVPISFAAPPGAAYDPTRLLVGLGLAVLLAAIAIAILRRTDWSAVGEAAAPEIDDAKYADLDAIIAALPPEEEEVVSTR